jgi:predicted alpha/beta-fold hydrolase
MMGNPRAPIAVEVAASGAADVPAPPPLPAAIAELRPYVAPTWLPGAHAQTIYPVLLKRAEPAFRRERVDTPDGDFWDFDWNDPPLPQRAIVPTVILFHGLEGGSDSHYARALMTQVGALGWRGVIPHFRGCGGEPNRFARAYHSGDYEDIDAMLAAIFARLPERNSASPVYAAGVSLGGSALLNWLGRAGRTAAPRITAAAAVSTPLDLTSAGIAIGRGLNLIYTRHFLQTLIPKSLALAERFPGVIDVDRVRRVRSMYDFDDIVTAPLHGFDGTDDYWKRASSKPWLKSIGIRTLVLNARNDPFVPAASLPLPREASADVLLEQPKQGGHAGFPAGPLPGNVNWMPQRLLQFFAAGR